MPTSPLFSSPPQVPVDAHALTIKDAARKLLLKHHPDRGGNNDNFRIIREAWGVLRDANSRCWYDIHLTLYRGGVRQGGGGGGIPRKPETTLADCGRRRRQLLPILLEIPNLEVR
jgi:curved DNA-binding protein CbpA